MSADNSPWRHTFDTFAPEYDQPEGDPPRIDPEPDDLEMTVEVDSFVPDDRSYLDDAPAEATPAQTGEPDSPFATSLQGLIREIAEAPEALLTRIARNPTPGFDGEILLARSLHAIDSMRDQQRRTWTGIARAMAILAPDHHDPHRDLAEVLAYHSIHEERVLALASAPTATMATDHMVEIARLLRKSPVNHPIAFNWQPVAGALLHTTAQRPLQKLIANFYASGPNNLIERQPDDGWECDL